MNPAEWEREALRETRLALSGEAMADDKKELVDLRLVGSHPDTRLIADVAFRGGEPCRFEFELWGPHFEAYPGRRDDPYTVGGTIFVRVMEWTGRP